MIRLEAATRCPVGRMPGESRGGGSDGCNCKQWSGEVARTDENGGSAEALLQGDSTTTFNEGEERDDLR